jgi:hypothetical protein
MGGCSLNTTGLAWNERTKRGSNHVIESESHESNRPIKQRDGSKRYHPLYICHLEGLIGRFPILETGQGLWNHAETV